MVTNVCQNALTMLSERFGPVKLRYASYVPGSPEFMIIMPKGVSFCDTCGNIFPGTGRYCDAHQPVTVQEPKLEEMVA